MYVIKLCFTGYAKLYVVSICYVYFNGTWRFHSLFKRDPWHFRFQVNAPMWKMSSGEHDGLTTNGIAFMRPSGTFESGVSPGEWREVTVMGSVRTLRVQRSSRQPGEAVSDVHLLGTFQSCLNYTKGVLISGVQMWTVKLLADVHTETSLNMCTFRCYSSASYQCLPLPCWTPLLKVY